MKKSFLKLAFLLLILLMIVNTASAVSSTDIPLLDQSSEDVSIDVIGSGSNNVSVNTIDLNVGSGSDDSSKDISVRDIESNVSSSSNVVSDEDDSIISLGDFKGTVKPLDEGASIPFDNGYLGFCVDMDLHAAVFDNSFTEGHPSIITNNVNGEPISEYLKILIFNNHETIKENPMMIQWPVWFLSDFDFTDPESMEMCPDEVLDVFKEYDAGVRIPDHNAVKKINETDYLVFDFISLVPDSPDVQTYFAYRAMPISISVNKTSNATGKVYKGDNLTYTIVVKNTNDLNMSYDVTDVLPEGLDFVDVSKDYDYDYDPSTRTIVWHIPNTAGETVTLYVYTIVNTSNTTIIESVVVSNKTYNITVGNNTNDTIEPVANITIIKVVDKKNVKIDEEVTWTIVVTNHGPDVAEDVTVTDVLPKEFIELISATPNKGTFDSATGVWTIGDLGKDESVNLVLLTKVIEANVTVINTATVTSPTPAYDDEDTINPNGTNKTASDYTEVLPIYNPNVNKTSNASGKVYKGDKLTYTIEVKNNNEYNVTYTVTDELPVGLNFVSASGNYSYDEDSRTIVWHIPTTANETVTLYVYVTVNVSNATIIESVVVSNETFNITVGNNTTDYVEPIVDLSIVKKVSVNKVKVGDKFVYTIVVKNNGPDVANNVIVKELLPSYKVKLISTSVNKGIYNEANNIWTIKTLNNGESATLKITVIATRAGVPTNFVNVDCDELDSDYDNNDDSVEVIISNNNNSNSTNNTNSSSNTKSIIDYGVIANHGIPMAHTGNPILVLSIMFVVLSTGLLRREK